MKTEYAGGREYQVEEPGDNPAAKDPYMMIFWEAEEKLNGVLALVELLHEKDAEIERLSEVIIKERNCNGQPERLKAKWNM